MTITKTNAQGEKIGLLTNLQVYQRSTRCDHNTDLMPQMDIYGKSQAAYRVTLNEDDILAVAYGLAGLDLTHQPDAQRFYMRVLRILESSTNNQRGHGTL